MTDATHELLPVTIPRELFDFLMGVGDIEGLHFGDLSDKFPGRFWWRSLMRDAEASQSHPRPGEVARLIRAANAVLAAMDAYNAENGTHLGGPVLFELGRSIAALTPAPCPGDVGVREAAEALLDGLFSTFRARNGREVGIEADDGEKCYIVHSDLVTRLRGTLADDKRGPKCGDDGALCHACSQPAHLLTQEPGCGCPLPAALTPSAQKEGFDREWCVNMAKKEAGYAIGAGELAIDPFTPSALSGDAGEGTQLVPVKPTEAMYLAAFDSDPWGGQPLIRRVVDEIWSAMLRAAHLKEQSK